MGQRLEAGFRTCSELRRPTLTPEPLPLSLGVPVSLQCTVALAGPSRGLSGIDRPHVIEDVAPRTCRRMLGLSSSGLGQEHGPYR